MKLRVLQVLFVAASLLFAALVVHQGQPHLLPATQAQGNRRVRPPEAALADRQAAITVILAQLNAFRKDDFATAMRYQSSGLKRRFMTPAAFRQMMQTGYPTFLHFRSATFGDARTPDQGSHLFVIVTLREKGGDATSALYFMVRERGSYKVDGVSSNMGDGPGHFPPAGAGPMGLPPPSLNAGSPSQIT